jgi:hypothetical protein
MSDFFSLTIYSRENNVSMILARVAGVPIPDSLMASRSASSVNSFPQVSIADNKLASVCSGRDLVCFSNKSAPLIGSLSPVESVGRAKTSSSPFSSSGAFNTARQPGTRITLPLTVNPTPEASNETIVFSLVHLPEKASNIRAAIISYMIRWSADISPGMFSVIIKAWWSVTFLSFTERLLRI